MLGDLGRTEKLPFLHPEVRAHQGGGGVGLHLFGDLTRDRDEENGTQNFVGGGSHLMLKCISFEGFFLFFLGFFGVGNIVSPVQLPMHDKFRM